MPVNDPYATAGRCPVCDATGVCPDAAPVPVAGVPLDLSALADTPAGGELRRYRVTQFGYPTTMRLNDTDAARYGDAAVPLD